MSRPLNVSSYAWLPTIILTFAVCSTATAQSVWSGLILSFSKPNSVDESLPEYQDRITDNVWLTRATTGGLFNIAQEPGFLFGDSPADTEWATDLLPANAGQTIAATNWASLNFDNWIDAYGGVASGQLPARLIGRDAVVHLISDDIYLDLRFSGWAQAGGGGFSYLRAVPEPAALVLALASFVAMLSVASRRLPA